MESNRLSLNCDKNKMEVVWCATSRRQHQLSCSALSVDSTLVKPVRSARDLGIYIDADLVMRTHVQRSRCFAGPDPSFSADRADRQVPDTGVNLVLTRLDYGNSVLAGLRSIWSTDSDQCWTRLCGWHITCGDPTTSPTRSSRLPLLAERPLENRVQDRRIDI